MVSEVSSSLFITQVVSLSLGEVQEIVNNRSINIFFTTIRMSSPYICMINDDILIKYSIANNYGGYTDWVSHVKKLSAQIRYIRDHDFTGIGAGDLSLISPGDVKAGDRIILSGDLGNNDDMSFDGASILGLVTRINPKDPMIIEMEVEGLGSRPDFYRDNDRLLKWGSKIYPSLREFPCLLRMDTKPKADGGAVYYYYNKSPRDLRVNYVSGMPEFSRRAILGTLRNTSQEDLSGVRPRAQYLHTYRRVAGEIRNLLTETPWDNELKNLLKIIQGATSIESKNISKQVWEKLNIAKN